MVLQNDWLFTKKFNLNFAYLHRRESRRYTNTIPQPLRVMVHMDVTVCG